MFILNLNEIFNFEKIIVFCYGWNFKFFLELLYDKGRCDKVK